MNSVLFGNRDLKQVAVTAHKRCATGEGSRLDKE
jgi:hypothetical protein